MNRADFMKQLESLLQNISSAEREEALQYYNEYFNDAGAENEQAVIEALGTPAKVAENIKRDLFGSGYGDGFEQRKVANDKALTQYAQTAGEASDAQASSGESKHKQLSAGMIALIVVLCILASPAILGVASGALGIVAGVITTWFALIVAFGVIALVLFALLVVLGIIGIFSLFTSPVAGIGLLGGGLICGGIGILFMMLTVAMAGIATPAIFKWIAGLFRKKQEAA